MLVTQCFLQLVKFERNYHMCANNIKMVFVDTNKQVFSVFIKYFSPLSLTSSHIELQTVYARIYYFGKIYFKKYFIYFTSVYSVCRLYCNVLYSMYCMYSIVYCIECWFYWSANSPCFITVNLIRHLLDTSTYIMTLKFLHPL